MLFPKEVLSELKCCFLNDGHIAIKPISFSCGAIGCKECIISSKVKEIDCYNCKGKHKTKDLKIIQVITPLENMVKSFVNDLFEYTKGNLEKT